MSLSRLTIGILCAPLFAGSLAVTVKDPAGAPLGDAFVSLTGQAKSTGSNGMVTLDNLLPGAYSVSISRLGFDSTQTQVTLTDQSADLPVSLKLSSPMTSVKASQRRSALANSDPNYQTLRTGKLRRVYTISNLVITRDAGTFTFRSGSFSFLPPVQGHVTTGVFVGEGNFQMKPADGPVTIRLQRMMGATSVNEDFTAMVVYFSDATFEEIKDHSELADETPTKHEEALKRVREVLRDRRQPYSDARIQRTWLETILNYEDIPNYDAEALAESYTHAGGFRAFLHGNKYPDLRFWVSPHGAMPMLRETEEVALLNFEPNSNSDGLWYFSHTLSELQAGRPDPKEEKRLIAPEHYRIETLIGNGLLQAQRDMAVVCNVSFRALEDGVRMAKLDLFPDLQVARVFGNGREIPFVQESPTHDGSFYVQMPEAMKKGETYNLTVEYAGGEILYSERGVFPGGVPSGRIWYPTPSGNAGRAAYDLTFRIVPTSKVATVGKPVRASREGPWDFSEWRSDVPITQAGFRWISEPELKTDVEATSKIRTTLFLSVPGQVFPLPAKSGMLDQVANALQLFTSWFGKPAYDDLALAVQTNRSTCSLPGLICAAPILTAGAAPVMARFGMPLPTPVRTWLNEGFAKLVAAQWWGNMLTPAGFHDQWLIDGLREFSASVYDIAADNGEFKDRWETAREQTLSGTRFAVRPNESGPLWMGMLNSTQKTQAAGAILNNSKGASVIHMLRSMMWDPVTHDRDFQTMMHDFVAQFANQAVSTADFQSVVEDHMKPSMDLGRNRKMDWFFDEWVFGTEVPTYRLEYSFRPGENGGTLLEGKLSQSGVSPSFRMLVPVYAELGGKTWRVNVAAVQGNSTSDFSVSLSARPKQILLNMNHDVLADKSEVIQAKH